MAAGSIGLSGMLSWAVPLFVMLSGMFVLDRSWYIGARDMSRKYVLRLVVAYIVWGTVAAMVNLMTGGVLGGMLSGTGFYLNFLFVMILLYAVSPILRVFTRSAQDRELQFAVLFGIVVGCVYPALRLGIGQASAIDYAVMGFGYLGVFLAGWLLRTVMLTRKQTRILYLLGGICLILSMRGVLFSSSAQTSDPSMMVLSPDAILVAAALFLVVKNTLAGMRLSRNVLRPISALAQLSFGIYLIHPILLAIVCYALNHAGIVLPTVVFIPVISILLLAVSGGIAMLIRKIPKIGAYLA